MTPGRRVPSWCRSSQASTSAAMSFRRTAGHGRAARWRSQVAMVENAWGFLSWLMARPEREIAVATHSLFLLALYHGTLEPEKGGFFSAPQVFHTAELRSVVVVERDAPQAPGRELLAWAPALVGPGLLHHDRAAERSRSPRRVVE
mmetsp:Transcript_17160/g.54976  ORF Transcript_17160/g.54976 Transcript_17160/m.54976 type:complete len:146 (+) Transcript_17160:323-760(+)